MGRGSKRQADRHRRPGAEAAANLELAAMPIDQAFHDRQPEPMAVGTSR
jgi:hypothetical protein